MKVSETVYDPVIDFIVSGMNAKEIIAFHPPQKSMKRLATLISKEKEGVLSTEEKSELDHHFMLEHIMRLAKARARKIDSD